MRRAVVWLLATGALWAIGPPAAAHALLRSSEPADGASLPSSPRAVTITFTEEPEPALSTIRVLNTTGRPLETGKVEIVPGDPLKLRVGLGDLPAGVYTATWRVVSRVDGHATGGAFAFGVGAPAGEIAARPGASAAPEPPSPLGVAGRWALYAGLGVLLGGAWTSVAAFATPPRSLLRLLRGAWPVAAGGLGALGASQLITSGVGLRTFAGTTLGRELLWRAVPLAVARVALIFAKPARRARLPLLVTGAAAAGVMIVHVAAGHAGAGGSRPLKIALQSVHMAAVGVWIGGLAALLAGTRGAPSDEKAAAVRRFSAVALFTVAVVAATGIVRAIGELRSWNALVSSGYGRLVLVKASLLVPLIALAAVNRYRNIPALSHSLGRLRRVSSGELALAGAILTATALLTAIAPPALQPERRVVVATGRDAGTTVRARLEVSPGTPGVNEFAIELADYDSGKPVAARRVALRFEFRGPDPVGVSTLELRRMKAGVWGGRGANLSLAGRWAIVALIERGADSVQVPLSVSLSRPPSKVSVQRVPGQPDLYTIELAQGSLQVYLDPGRAGPNQVHATFFDPAGAELAVENVRMWSTPPGGRRTELDVLRFGPGHVAANVEGKSGTWTIEVSAAREGAPLAAKVKIVAGKELS